MNKEPLPPLISVAVCTYNGEQFLAQQIESLLAQDYPNFEIVVCDDCSSDKTLEIARQFQSSKISVHQNSVNVGFNKNFERAFQLCRGDFIAPCDQDDIWDPKKLSVLAAAIGNNMVAYCDSEFVDTQNRSLGIKLSSLVNMYSGEDSRPFILENCVAGHAMLFRKELLVRAMPITSVYFFDWWLAYIAASCGGVLHVDQCLVRYRQHSTSQTDRATLKPKPKTEMSARARTDSQIAWLTQLERIDNKDCAAAANKLHSLIEARYEQYFSLRLAFFLFNHRRVLLFMMYASADRFRPYKHIWRSIFGFKLKRLYKPEKYAVHK